MSLILQPLRVDQELIVGTRSSSDAANMEDVRMRGEISCALSTSHL